MSLLRKQQPPPSTYARYTEGTKEWATPKAVAAKEWAAPRVEPAVTKVREEVVPVVAGAVTGALAASEPVRQEAGRRGKAAVAALKGELDAPKPKKHRLRKLMLVVSVLGAAYAGWKAFFKSSDDSDPTSPWTTPSSGMSTSPSTGTAGTSFGNGSGADGAGGPVLASDTKPETQDVGGASPDEALADEAAESAAVEDSTAANAEMTTEPVTPSAAKKASSAAAKAPKPKST